MPSSTSTLMTSRARPKDTAPRLRTRGQAREGNNDDIFFWTYTEEPHRTRRQAIIKAHPDVGCSTMLAMATADILIIGHQTLRARTIDQVLRFSSRAPSSTVCISLAKHALSIMAVLLNRLHNWGYGKSKSLPCYSRDIPQSGFQITTRQ